VFVTGIAAVVDLCSGKSVRGVMNVMDTDISKLSLSIIIIIPYILNAEVVKIFCK